MKKIMLVLSTIVLIVASCGDPCDDVTCINGGTCFEGECQCPSGFTGPACQNSPCDNVTCFNGGTCIFANGQCACPEGYGGNFCEHELTPSSLRINSVRVAGFPATTSTGGGWDFSSGADLILTIQGGGVTIYDSPNIFEDANPSIAYNFTQGFPITINNVTTQHSIFVSDFDSFDPNDFMGGFNFNPYNQDGGFPDPLIITNSSTNLTFTLDVTWIH